MKRRQFPYFCAIVSGICEQSINDFVNQLSANTHLTLALIHNTDATSPAWADDMAVVITVRS